MRIARWVALAGVLVATLWGAGATANEGDTAMADQTLKMRCVGRHLIAVPDTFELLEGSHLIDGMTIDALGPGDDNAARDAFAGRRAELQEGRATDQGVALILRPDPTTGAVSTLGHAPDMSSMGAVAEDWTEESYFSAGGEVFRVTAFIPGDAVDDARARQQRLVAAVRPKRDTDVPGAAGACIDDIFVALPALSEVHRATFVPTSGETPMGLNFEVVLRAAEDPPLDIETRFQSRRAERVEVAGLPGHQLQLTDGQLSFAAIVGEDRDGQGTLLTVEYYDERPDFGAEPMPSETISALWEDILSSVQFGGGR